MVRARVRSCWPLAERSPHLRPLSAGPLLEDATWRYNGCHMARAQSATTRIAHRLGITTQRQVRDPDLREAILRGLPYASFEALASTFHIAKKDLVTLLRVPPRTLARRKRARRFGVDESDRLFRIGRIAAEAEDVLGGQDKAAAWLQAPNRALGGRIPLYQLDTDLGAREVEDVLLRIAHGVYS
jgi:putative toxin-antitoxin system antitoxin component (TIGR02293 family)